MKAEGKTYRKTRMQEGANGGQMKINRPSRQQFHFETNWQT